MIRVTRLQLTDDKRRSFSAVIRWDGSLYWVKVVRARRASYLDNGYASLDEAMSAIRVQVEAVE